MDISRGFNLSDRSRDELKALVGVGGAEGASAGVPVAVNGLLEGDGAGDAGRLRQGVVAAVDDGLLEWVDPGIEELEPEHVRLTRAGRQTLADLHERRADRHARHLALRDALLGWLAERYVHDDTSPVLSDFTNSGWGSYYLEAFTDADLTRGTNALKDEGWISGTGSYGGPVARPMITAGGRRLVDQGRSVRDGLRSTEPSTVFTGNYTFNGPAQVNQNSPGSTQNVTITTQDRAQLGEFAANLRQLAVLFPEIKELTGAADELVAVAADPALETGRLMGVLRRARDAAVLASSGAVGAGLGGLVVTALDGYAKSKGLT